MLEPILVNAIKNYDRICQRYETMCIHWDPTTLLMTFRLGPLKSMFHWYCNLTVVVCAVVGLIWAIGEQVLLGKVIMSRATCIIEGIIY